jgi:hypothetical protein
MFWTQNARRILLQEVCSSPFSLCQILATLARDDRRSRAVLHLDPPFLLSDINRNLKSVDK